jgi:solute carrier family 13 (sodium-dependent dicarboxylate transporter), member 2/3/5
MTQRPHPSDMSPAPGIIGGDPPHDPERMIRGDRRSSEDPPLGALRKVGLPLGPLVFLAMLLSPVPADLSVEGWRTAAIGVLMAIWWMTEAVPIPATALLPLVLFPVLGVDTIGGTAAPYAQPTIFLFMGGFMIALAMQRWNLHRRIALNIIGTIGTKPSSIITGFMVASAFLSMWVSNTATTLMMLPIGMSVIELARRSGTGAEAGDQSGNFAIALMLGIAYASSIGGVATLVGTPTNALMAGFLAETYGFQIDFVRWMMIGVPLTIIGLPIIHFVLTRLAYPLRVEALPGGREYMAEELARLGRVSEPEILVAGVFGLVATLWVLQPLLSTWVPDLSDAGIAIFGGLLLFLIPTDLRRGTFLLDWHHAERLPWGVLILFGGGLTLASAIQRTGLAAWIGGFLAAADGWPIIALIAIAVVLIIFLTELTSNTATTAAFLPIMAALAIAVGENPLLLAIPVTIAASCAFMLPVATPPNAIIYGSGMLTIPQMARAGFVLNVVFSVVITLLAYTLVVAVFGVDSGVVPDWAVR